MKFKIEKFSKNSLARAGVIETDHGNILTPSFIPVGTKATVKSLSPEQVRESLSQAVLANTYHLYLEPGENIIEKSGGLHKFMNWQGPIFTDSGGFQAFSLGIAFGQGIGKFISKDEPEREVLEQGFHLNNKKAKVTEEGVHFKSVIDGSSHFMSPEKSIEIQNTLGADIIFALDEFTSPHSDFEKINSTIERTYRWAVRCLDTHKSSLSYGYTQALFGIVQGGRHKELREKSAKDISSLPFDGFGIGGTFIKEDMNTAVRWVNEILPEEKPRHLLGVGEPIDMILGVESGIDTFDCVGATRMARNGTLYTSFGKINILNAKYKNFFEPIEKGCTCYSCTNYTCSYISHLFRAKEMFAATLASIHNIFFLNKLMQNIRNSILNDSFEDCKQNFMDKYKQ